MKKNKITDFVIIFVVIAGMFLYFKYKLNKVKDTKNHQMIEEVTPETSGQTSTTTDLAESTQSAPLVVKDSKVATPEAPSINKHPKKDLDPLLIKISIFYKEITRQHEAKIREMFKNENKEEFMNNYMSLQEERIKRLSEVLKTDNSRATAIYINYEYHNKLYAIIGKDLYIKYLKILKETNDNAKKTKIIVEF